MSEKIGRRGLLAFLAGLWAWLTNASNAKALPTAADGICVFINGVHVPVTHIARDCVCTNVRAVREEGALAEIQTTVTLSTPSDGWEWERHLGEPFDIQVFHGEHCTAGRFRILETGGGKQGARVWTKLRAVTDNFRAVL